MKLVFYAFALLILSLSFGAFISVFVFIVDVSQWHKMEKRLKIVPSAQKLPDDIIEESEVKQDERDNGDNTDPTDDDRTDEGKSDSRVIFSSWLRS